MTRALKNLRVLAEYIGLYAGLLLLGTMLLAATALCLVMIVLTPRHKRRRTGRWFASATFRAYLRLLQMAGLLRADLHELDELAADRSLVIVPNHPCLLDALLVISRLPNVACIMKADLWDNPFLGAGARMAGYIRNDSARCMVRQAVEDLRTDGHLLVFPEGTRTLRKPVNPLKGACALIAKRARVPLQVVIIETDSPFLSKGWPLWRKPAFPLHYRVRLGQRIEPRGSVEELMAQLAQNYERELSARRAAAPVYSRSNDTPIDA